MTKQFANFLFQRITDKLSCISDFGFDETTDHVDDIEIYLNALKDIFEEISK